MFCDKCCYSFTEWEPTDVPLTEHKKSVDCPFIRDLIVNSVKRNNSNVCEAMERNLYTFDTMLKAVQDNPSLLDKPFDEFLCAMISRHLRTESTDEHKMAQPAWYFIIPSLIRYFFKTMYIVLKKEVKLKKI